jgi:UDP-2-acetamido-3-amino-2,3-dideoxy-glucuronate N-acetyltransferase
VTAAPLPRILQVGVGGFGLQHLRAWQEIGARDQLWIADLDAGRLSAAARLLGLPPNRATTDPAAALPHVDVVDVVTGTEGHYPVCAAALEAGKDVFVEKPMTSTSDEARRLRDLADAHDRLLQVGYYYRCHPAARRARALIESGGIGDVRYLSGAFLGFKRARNDAGVTQTDAVHFIDLFNWLLDRAPARVSAITRDHFGRGLEDLSLVLLEYPGNILAKVESGYIQPGRWRDRVVPNAFTTKDVVVCGSRATLEIDFEQERLDVHHVRHELRDGVWTAIVDGRETPTTATMTPVQMIAAELRGFLDCVATRRRPDADAGTAGVLMADIVQAVYASAARGAPVDLRP